MASSSSSARGALALGPLLRVIVRTYRAHARFLVGAALVVVVPAALFDVLSTSLAGGVDLERNLTFGLAVTLASTVVFFGGSVGHQIYTGLITSTVAATRAGNPRPTLAQLWPGLPIVALVAADVVYSIGVGAGFLLLIVPGVVFATWYALVAPVIDLEQHSLRGAFARSRELVRGHFWPVLAVVALFAGASELLSTAIVAVTDAHGLLGKWLVEIAVDIIAIPLYGVAIATTTLELLALEGPPGP